MPGTYRMVSAGSQEFDIQIAPFAFRGTYTDH
jgi:hypothetical protein